MKRISADSTLVDTVSTELTGSTQSSFYVRHSNSSLCAEVTAGGSVGETTAPLMSPRHPKLIQQDPFRIVTNENQELGTIPYQFSSLDEAIIAASERQCQIIFVEVEVPGDTEAGAQVLSHPLIVEAVSSLFITCGVSVPRKRLSKMSIPQPDFTKLRILDGEGADVMPGISGEHISVGNVASAMAKALRACNYQVPIYLSLLIEEETGRQKVKGAKLQRVDRKATFGTASSSNAEVIFSGLDGVIGTSAGFINGGQVVEVTYDSSRLCYGSLVRYALQNIIAEIIYFQSNDERLASLLESQRVRVKAVLQEHEGTKRIDLNSKQALRQTMMRAVPLTELQATRANRLCHQGKFNEAMHLLSPFQGIIMMRAMRFVKYDVVDVPIMVAWKNMPRASGVNN